MTLPRLSNLEMRIMEILWAGGELSVREIQEKFPARKPPAYTTVQTMVQRLEAKKAVRRVGKMSTAFIFEAAIPRDAPSPGRLARYESHSRVRSSRLLHTPPPELRASGSPHPPPPHVM